MVDGCKVSLEYIKHLAFDEPDNMLDLGFDDQVQQLVNELGMPAKELCQTVMFSAIMRDFVMVTAGSSPAPITQCVKWIDDAHMRDTLRNDVAATLRKDVAPRRARS